LIGSFSIVLSFHQLPDGMRRNLLFEAGYAVCNGVFAGLALLAQVTVVRGLGGSEAAVLVTAAMPASILQPLWVGLANRFRLQHMVLASGTLRCLPLLAVAFGPGPWMFAVLVASTYLLAGPLSLAVPSLYKYMYADSHRGRIIGLLRLCQHLVTVPAVLGSAWLMDREPSLYRLLFPAAGAVGLLGLLFYSRLRIPTDLPGERALATASGSVSGFLRVLRQDRNFRLFQSTIFLTGAGFLMTRAVWIYLLAVEFNLSQLELAFLVQVMPLVLSGLTAPLWGGYIDRTSPVAGRIAFALLGIFAYGLLFASFFWQALGLAYAGAVLRGLVLGAAEVSMTTGNLYFSLRRERAALYESASAVLQGARGLLMPALGWQLFLLMGSYLMLAPTVLNLWSLYLAMKLWELDRRESILMNPPAQGAAPPSPAVDCPAGIRPCRLTPLPTPTC